MWTEATCLEGTCGFEYFAQLSDQESQFGLETIDVNSASTKPKNLQERED